MNTKSNTTLRCLTECAVFTALALALSYLKIPIGFSFGQYNEIDKDTFCRNPFEDLSREAVAYSLYKYAATRKIVHLRVFDLFKQDATGGIYKEFCINKSTFEDILRSLDADTTHVLTAELNMGLDSITLREDLTPYSVLKSLLHL